jgi:hypothetical protein
MCCLHFDLSELRYESKPSDPELVDLNEGAVPEGQIDGLTVDLAYLCLSAEKGRLRPKCCPGCYPKE